MMFVCTTAGCVSDDDPQGSSVGPGDSLPEFSVIMNDGETVSPGSLKGKVAVIVFFNTDCSDCRKELPVIQDLWEYYRENEAVKIVTISRQESEEEILKYWQENGLSLPFSPQESKDVYNLFAKSVIPRIYIANKQGIITDNFDDSDMPDLGKLKAAIDANL